MIDIHSHILPGVDDGAKTEEDSLAMARAAVKQGIDRLIATPHHMNGIFQNKKATILQHVDILNRLIAAHDIPLTVLYGQEVRIYGELLADIDAGKIQTLHNTRYLLVELPFENVPLYTEKLIYDLQMKGIIPIIAHPERNAELRAKPGKMYDLVLKGALTQVTAGSLLGHFGKEAEAFSHDLIEHNLTHFVASDAHDIDKRPFTLKEAYDLIEKDYGKETYHLLEENTHLLLDDLIVNRNEPTRIRRKKQGLFNFWKK